MIDNLINAGFDEATFDAIRLVPCVAVAWADGFVLPGEIEALRQASEAFGITAGSPAESISQGWLRRRPDESLFQVWAKYFRKMSLLQTPLLRLAMARQIIEHSELVAKAAGGFFGIATISHQERKVLAQIQAVLSDGSADESRLVA